MYTSSVSIFSSSSFFPETFLIPLPRTLYKILTWFRHYLFITRIWFNDTIKLISPGAEWTYHIILEGSFFFNLPSHYRKQRQSTRARCWRRVKLFRIASNTLRTALLVPRGIPIKNRERKKCDHFPFNHESIFLSPVIGLLHWCRF